MNQTIVQESVFIRIRDFLIAGVGSLALLAASFFFFDHGFLKLTMLSIIFGVGFAIYSIGSVMPQKVVNSGWSATRKFAGLFTLRPTDVRFGAVIVDDGKLWMQRVVVDGTAIADLFFLIEEFPGYDWKADINRGAAGFHQISGVSNDEETFVELRNEKESPATDLDSLKLILTVCSSNDQCDKTCCEFREMLASLVEKNAQNRVETVSRDPELAA